MHSQLHHVVAKQRSAELRRSGERARFASAANAQRPNLRKPQSDLAGERAARWPAVSPRVHTATGREEIG